MIPVNMQNRTRAVILPRVTLEIPVLKKHASVIVFSVIAIIAGAARVPRKRRQLGREAWLGCCVCGGGHTMGGGRRTIYIYINTYKHTYTFYMYT